MKSVNSQLKTNKFQVNSKVNASTSQVKINKSQPTGSQVSIIMIPDQISIVKRNRGQIQLTVCQSVAMSMCSDSFVSVQLFLYSHAVPVQLKVIIPAMFLL